MHFSGGGRSGEVAPRADDAPLAGTPPSASTVADACFAVHRAVRGLHEACRRLPSVEERPRQVYSLQGFFGPGSGPTLAAARFGNKAYAAVQRQQRPAGRGGALSPVGVCGLSGWRPEDCDSACGRYQSSDGNASRCLHLRYVAARHSEAPAAWLKVLALGQLLWSSFKLFGVSARGAPATTLHRPHASPAGHADPLLVHGCCQALCPAGLAT